MKIVRKFSSELWDQLSFFLGVPAIVWQVFFFFIPLLFILYLSFASYTPVGGVMKFGLQNYAALMDATFGLVIVRSFILAFINAFFAILFAYPIAYYIAVVVKKFKLFWLFLLLLPFWTNFLLHVYAWFFILERGGVLNTILQFMGIISEPLVLLNSVSAVMLVMFYCYLPFMVLPIYSILEKLDLNLLEASADLGANSRQTFFRVTLPLTLPGLQLGFFLVFVPSFGEFAIPALIGGNKISFVGSLISFLFLEGGNQPLACAFTVVSIFCILLVALGFYRLSKLLVLGK